MVFQWATVLSIRKTVMLVCHNTTSYLNKGKSSLCTTLNTDKATVNLPKHSPHTHAHTHKTNVSFTARAQCNRVVCFHRP